MLGEWWRMEIKERNGSVFPKRWIVDKGIVRQGSKESDEAGFFRLAELKWANEAVLIRMAGAAAIVVFDNCFKGRQAAIVHVRRREGHIAQRRYAKLTFILRFEGYAFPSGVLISLVQAVVAKAVVGKVESLVTVGAAGTVAEE